MSSLISIPKESQKNTFQDINKIYKISLKSYSWFLSFILLEIPRKQPLLSRQTLL